MHVLNRWLTRGPGDCVSFRGVCCGALRGLGGGAFGGLGGGALGCLCGGAFLGLDRGAFGGGFRCGLCLFRGGTLAHTTQFAPRLRPPLLTHGISLERARTIANGRCRAAADSRIRSWLPFAGGGQNDG
ncbi:hypothetical protein [Microbacterium bovistercoris]|uniref:hypothetical protein n=1 Tax=Microbacterium bovistercoris TaxID=2293570 RepID=UPI0015F28586|nr:hypothetical protein [Microbacterium bovistercoris]